MESHSYRHYPQGTNTSHGEYDDRIQRTGSESTDDNTLRTYEYEVLSDSSIGQGDINLWNISVVAGHFSWGIWNSLPSYQHHHLQHQPQPNKTSDTDSQRNSNRDNLSDNISFDSSASDSPTVPSVSLPPPSCFVMGRHPISRAISFYYERCYHIVHCQFYHRHMNELSVEQLYSVILPLRGLMTGPDNETVIITDDGIQEQSCRILSDNRGTMGYPVQEFIGGKKIMPVLPPDALEKSLRNVQSCIVGIQEKWEDTKNVIKFWFLWILEDDFEIANEVFKSEESKNNNDNNNNDSKKDEIKLRYDHSMSIHSTDIKKDTDRETVDTLRTELRILIENENRCDMQLYDAMLLQFNKQMEILNNEFFFT